MLVHEHLEGNQPKDSFYSFDRTNSSKTQGVQMFVCRFDDVSLLYLIIIFIANKTLMYTTNNVIGSGIRTNLDSGFKEFGYNSDSYE